ncbi:LOW QUALITY PROTEIN: putative uncharacterized protein encoded by LINC00242 [Pan troglodytes]|uniref:LOW QUALITY PROTEIN: putative uncharacterized protein encoded by LINC00242 n=1 Tax=Pan troglodytes TaxID=9598 RepID=UPI000036DAAB|nr:LOW QUALITY PROTEIN: putative uncharacterized protein encoded by LINC00242 [Pan troglodytes]
MMPRHLLPHSGITSLQRVPRRRPPSRRREDFRRCLCLSFVSTDKDGDPNGQASPAVPVPHFTTWGSLIPIDSQRNKERTHFTWMDGPPHGGLGTRFSGRGSASLRAPAGRCFTRERHPVPRQRKCKRQHSTGRKPHCGTRSAAPRNPKSIRKRSFSAKSLKNKTRNESPPVSALVSRTKTQPGQLHFCCRPSSSQAPASRRAKGR